MKNNNKFSTPVISVCRFSAEDVITTSAVTLTHLAGAYELSMATVMEDAYERFSLENEFAAIDHQ